MPGNIKKKNLDKKVSLMVGCKHINVIQECISVLAAPRRKEQYLPGSACDTQIALFVSMVR